MTTVRVEGLAALGAALAELPRATGNAVLRRVLRAAGAPIAAAASAAAPVDTGVLKGGIAVSAKLARSVRKAAGRGAVRQAGGGFRSAKSTGVEVYVGPAGAARVRGQMVEFGTADTPAQPFLRPAWDSQRGHALDIVKAGLGGEIAKAAARLARKAARAAAKASA